MEDDMLQCRRDAEHERAERRAELFLPVSNQVANLSLRHPNAEPDGGGEDDLKVVEEIESLCMNCEKDGITRLLLTKIPYFREVIIMSFYCQHCHFKNTEVQSAGEIQEQGVKYVLKMDHSADMERQIVKSDTAVFRVEDLDLEVPPGRGKLTNLEGVLSEILHDLEHGQKRRKREEPDLYEKLDAIIQSLLKMMNGGRFPYSISLDDPAGNSWIEPSPKDSASKYIRTEYPRSPEQNAALGLGGEETEELESREAKAARLGITGPVYSGPVEGGTMHSVEILHGQMYSLPCLCPGCGKYAMMNVQMVNVPYFKQVIISAVVCNQCGYRTNDVKTGGEIPNQGQRILLHVKDPIDLRRDILKSETCCLKIPACRVEVVPGTMGGRFTTVEGLLTQIRDDLRGSIFDVDDVSGSGGDSMPEERKKGWDDFFAVLEKAIRGEMQYTIHLEDPLSNSYVQSLTAPDRDPQIEIEDYERTEEEEEELGLADMRTKLNAEGEYVREVAESLSKHPVGQAILQSTSTTCSGIGADSTGRGQIPATDIDDRV